MNLSKSDIKALRFVHKHATARLDARNPIPVSQRVARERGHWLALLKKAEADSTMIAKAKVARDNYLLALRLQQNADRQLDSFEAQFGKDGHS